jgi:ATP-dependent RNA helicase DDX51/DBP6
MGKRQRAGSPPGGSQPRLAAAPPAGDVSPDADAAEAAVDSAASPAPAAPAAAAAVAKLRAPAALAWMRTAATIDAARVTALADVPNMDARLKATLQAAHIDRLFPVQATVWDVLRSEQLQPHDLCISAPTGSGKTLAYALPLVAALSGRVIRRLRALVVLPTHDLAQQVGAARAARVQRPCHRMR